MPTRMKVNGRFRRTTLLLILAILVTTTIQFVNADRSRASTADRVSRAGSELMLNGARWRFAGVNMYWLGLDDNVKDAQGATYPSHAKIDDGFSSARTLGASVVRSTSMGVSVGSPRSIEPSLGRFNDAAFDTIDYSVASAARNGIHLMIPLTDMWHYYHGGRHTFTTWAGYSDLPDQTSTTSPQQEQVEQHFYTDPAVVTAFHDYIAHLLNHVNPYTGLRLGDDPTIAIWETGNELWDAPASWTAQTATFIKSLAPLALVADGSAATGKHVSDAAIGAADVDIVGGHFYPTDAGWAATDAATAAAHGKAYVVGEFALAPAGGPDPAGWLAGLAADPNVSGAMAWALMPHLADGTPEVSGDGYGFHVPGTTAAEVQQVAVFGAAARLFDPSKAPAPASTPGSTVAQGLGSASVAWAASPSVFVAGGSGSSAPTLATGADGGRPIVRATATAAGYAWLYVGAYRTGVAVTPGSMYSVSLAVRGAHLADPTARGSAELSWYDASGTWLSGSTGLLSTITGDWVTVTVTARAPASAAWAVPQWGSATQLAAGDVVDMTSVGMEF